MTGIVGKVKAVPALPHCLLIVNNNTFQISQDLLKIVMAGLTRSCTCLWVIRLMRFHCKNNSKGFFLKI